MNNIAIVVITYNRINSLKRLLNSLDKAKYNGNEITLIISIDNSGTREIANFANQFRWEYGEKIIIEHPKRLGLKNHVLSCGRLTKDYEAVVILEDDIYVSPYFYSYVIETIDKYGAEENIAGISLYTHLWNMFANRPFIPQDNGKDAYFMQCAQSWGQIWTRRMWTQFYDWYLDNNHELLPDKEVPYNITSWPKSSWLKYYNYYIIKTNKYFVYPYIALSTNFTDSGTHNKEPMNSYQVPILWCEKEEYQLPEFNKSELRYDIFFEIEGIGQSLGIDEKELCVDLYGNKSNISQKRYWLTTKLANYKIINSFALQMRPHELNILADLRGDEIFLYDTNTTIPINSSIKEKKNIMYRIKYDSRALTIKDIKYLYMYELQKKFKRILKRLISKR